MVHVRSVVALRAEGGGVKADIVERIKFLEDKNGRLTPEIVVQDAKNLDSPLHEEFEWNDAKAAAKFRIEQARDLIQRVRVEVKVHEQSIRVPLYVRDPEAKSDEQGYRSIVRLRDERQLAHEALTMEFSRAASAIERARKLSVAFDLESVFVELLEQVENAKAVVEQRVAA